MVKYYKQKVGDELYKAVPIEQTELEMILKEFNTDYMMALEKIEDGERLLVGGYYLHEATPVYGLCIGLKFPECQKYIKVYESLDATYLFQHKECEAVVNCREYIDMLIRIYKLSDRIEDNIEITDIILSEEYDRELNQELNEYKRKWLL